MNIEVIMGDGSETPAAVREAVLRGTRLLPELRSVSAMKRCAVQKSLEQPEGSCAQESQPERAGGAYSAFDLAEVGRIWREEPSRQDEAVDAYERQHGVKLEECGDCCGTGRVWETNLWGEESCEPCPECEGNSLYEINLAKEKDKDKN